MEMTKACYGCGIEAQESEMVYEKKAGKTWGYWKCNKCWQNKVSQRKK